MPRYVICYRKLENHLDSSSLPLPSGDPVGEATALRELPSHLSVVNIRISESLDLDTVLQDGLDSARDQRELKRKKGRIHGCPGTALNVRLREC